MFGFGKQTSEADPTTAVMTRRVSTKITLGAPWSMAPDPNSPAGPKAPPAGAARSAVLRDGARKDFVTTSGRTHLKEACLADGLLTDADGASSADDVQVEEVVLQGVKFRSPVSLKPGTLRRLKAGVGDVKLCSLVRVSVVPRLRRRHVSRSGRCSSNQERPRR